MKTIKIEAKIDNLPLVLSFIDEELEAAECPMKVLMKLDIAVEELFVNVASYAYAPEIGNCSIEIEIEEEPRMAVITLRDNGIPYNPLLKDDPDVAASSDKRKIGGLGIFMVKKSVDVLEYQYQEGQNIVTIRKMF